MTDKQQTEKILALEAQVKELTRKLAKLVPNWNESDQWGEPLEPGTYTFDYQGKPMQFTVDEQFAHASGEARLGMIYNEVRQLRKST